MNLTEILSLCVSKNASDLHLSALKPVMVRIDGKLKKLNIEPFDSASIEKLIFPLLTEDDRLILNKRLDYDRVLDFGQIGRCRLSLFYQSCGLSVVFRFISRDIPNFTELGLPAVAEKLLQKRQGLILITGATGSGKSTTLASMINWLNFHIEGHIITIEDPIEFLYSSNKCLINQREIGHSTLSFNQALKASLREDPDYLVIGELRDSESIRLCLAAAETGHLVFATLHSSSSTKAIDRIISTFDVDEQSMVRMMLSESLEAVITQRLVNIKPNGRVAAFEILIATSAIRHLIRQDKIPQMYSAIQMGNSEGMQTLDQALARLYQNGIIEHDISLDV